MDLNSRFSRLSVTPSSSDASSANSSASNSPSPAQWVRPQHMSLDRVKQTIVNSTQPPMSPPIKTAVHRGRVYYSCSRCNQRFLTEQRRLTHVNTFHAHAHHYKCTKCNKGFGSSLEYARHSKMHKLFTKKRPDIARNPQEAVIRVYMDDTDFLRERCKTDASQRSPSLPRSFVYSKIMTQKPHDVLPCSSP